MSRQQESEMISEDDPWGDLVVSLLSVNHYPLDRAYGLLKQLRIEKLTDPEELAKRSAPELYGKLIAAGYNRGEFITYLLAERLSSLGAFAVTNGIKKCETVIRSSDIAARNELLLSIKGIGPAVIENFRILRHV